MALKFYWEINIYTFPPMSDLVPVGWNLNLKSELPHDVSQKVSTSGEASVSNRVWRHSTELSVPCTPVRTLG